MTDTTTYLQKMKQMSVYLLPQEIAEKQMGVSTEEADEIAYVPLQHPIIAAMCDLCEAAIKYQDEPYARFRRDMEVHIQTLQETIRKEQSK